MAHTAAETRVQTRYIGETAIIYASVIVKDREEDANAILVT
jgi:hypothetical protein